MKSQRIRKHLQPIGPYTITVMVSVYNSSKWLRLRLDNLLAMTTADKSEIWCANASSPDPQDAVILAEYAAQHANVKVIDLPFCTVYGAWNEIIKRSDSDFICNANSDDLCAPNCHEQLVLACHEYDAPLAYCDWYSVGGEMATWGKFTGTASSAGAYNPDSGLVSCGHFPLWRRSLHEQVGMFDPWFQALGDADFWYRGWKMGVRGFYRLRQPLGAYRWRSGDDCNLWHRVEGHQRAAEWEKLYSRTAEKLNFADAISAAQ